MIRLIPLAITILLIILANSAYCSTVEDVIQTLSSISEPSVTNWRYIAGDVPDAKMPDFDDSNWKTGSPEFIWGEEPIAWMRTAITIPEEIAGFQVKGARIILRVAVDDDGIIFVNGKEADTFNWDNGRAVLTDNAVPGDVISVAIKGINRIGPGRLMQAWLEVEPLTDIRMRIQAYLADIETAKTLAGNNSEIIEKSIATVDLTAIQTGDRQKLIDSLSQASDILTILAPDIKNNTCHLVGHAHIDMNWLWLWPETIEVCNNTFNTMCKLMQEYPDFLYSQSQPSTYVIVEETNPDLFKSIGQRIKEGRWEVTGGTWVEGDMNMASGESIVRQILYAKQYFKEKFNVEPRICWSPDTFGHAWTIPQILAKSNIDFYYFMRAGKGEPIFWWEAPDGSRVLAFNDDNYNGDIKDSIGQEMAEMHKQYGVKDHLVVYGVGDHGGGPTRGQLRKARELQHRTLFPTVKFSTAEQFFKAILPKSDTFPVIRDELNFVFRGCYTTHSDIKKMNRTLENLLPSAEAFSAITSTLYDSIDYPIDDFKTAWQSTCFNQFHDIFDGTSIHGAYEHSYKLYEQAYDIGKSSLTSSFDTLTSKIDIRGDGVPVVVFNPLAWERTDVVEIDSPFDTEETSAVVVTDGKSTFPAQLCADKLIFTAYDMPALGYKVFWLKQDTRNEKSAVSAGNNTLENEFFRIKIDPKQGTIAEIYDKNTKQHIVPKGAQANLFQILYEESTGMSAWNLGQIMKTEDLTTPSEDSEILEAGPTRAL
ncbi:MAG TPA: glycoside hydrolase family 38 C-terminal domain-containing protein, partial [Armatimonadota bacterium]|nr:glycoside hydrolase family 38 C-terminal domain-containing protein [Armatimonadota bacterium]